MAKIHTVATAAAAALSTSYSSFALATVPDHCDLDWIHVYLSATSTATTVTLYLALDSAGDYAITDENTISVVDQGTGSSKGGADLALKMAWSEDIPGATAGTVYLRIKCDAGTPTVAPALICSQEV